MLTFPDHVWFALAVIAGAAVLGMLHSFAIQARNEVALHDLKLQARRLQDEYTRRLAELTRPNGAGDAEVVGVDVLDDEDDAEPAAAMEAAVEAVETAGAPMPGPDPETAGRVGSDVGDRAEGDRAEGTRAEPAAAAA